METNADSRLTPEQRAKLQAEDDQLEYVGQQIEERIRDTKTEGQGYTPTNFDGADQIVVTYDMLKEENKEEFAPVIPAGYEYDEDGRVIWVLSPYHFHMVKEGRVCHACLEWQSDLSTPLCTWRGKTEGCGAERVGTASMNEVFGRRK